MIPLFEVLESELCCQPDSEDQSPEVSSKVLDGGRVPGNVIKIREQQTSGMILLLSRKQFPN